MTSLNAPVVKVDSMVLARSVRADERVLLRVRPSLWYVILRPLVSIVVTAGASIAAWKLLEFLADRVGRGDELLNQRLHEGAAIAVAVGFGVVLLRIIWQTLDWYSRSYLLTDRRAVRVAGVLRKNTADIPLRNVQHLTMHRSLRERLTGVGTIGINSSGTAVTEMYWMMMAQPERIMDTLRAAVDAAQQPRHATPVTQPPWPAGVPGRADSASQTHRRPIVIGLVGGIGAGKSAVANEFARLGAVVVDSDREAKAALRTPEVRSTLISWWGDSILTATGEVDRKKVADRVFADPGERARLENLIHPIVHRARAASIERAREEGRELVVVDAPLLYEAGVDRECDRVVFVDAPLERRRAWVAARGWTGADLELREKAQWPLEEKRRRADDILVNDSSREDLPGKVASLLQQIQSTLAQHASPGPVRMNPGAGTAGPA